MLWQYPFATNGRRAKTAALFMIALVSLIPELVGAADLVKDFRNVVWGMTKDQVVASEKDQPDEITANEVKYQITLNDMPCCLIYHFDEQKLTTASYKMKPLYHLYAEYTAKYFELRKILADKYGGFKTNGKWTIGYTDGESLRYLQSGQTVYEDIWIGNGRTSVRLVMFGNNEKQVEIWIEYNRYSLPADANDF